MHLQISVNEEITYFFFAYFEEKNFNECNFTLIYNAQKNRTKIIKTLQTFSSQSNFDSFQYLKSSPHHELGKSSGFLAHLAFKLLQSFCMLFEISLMVKMKVSCSFQRQFYRIAEV